LLLVACAPSQPIVASTPAPAPSAAAPAPSISVSALPSASVAAAPSPALLPVPKTVAMSMRDIRARVLAAKTGPKFPMAPAPSLSGIFSGLAFGMTSAEAKAAAPAITEGIRDYTASPTNDKWISAGPAPARVRIDKYGVDMIELEFASEVTALSTLEAAWGKPRVGDSGFRWHVWLNPTHSIRAVVLEGEKQKLTRLELLPYRPLAELLADGGELALAGKHLLDATTKDLALLPGDGENYHLLPGELTSGHLPLKITVKDDRVVSYILGVDWTYDHPVEQQVRSALEKHFGPATPEPADPWSKKTCVTFPQKTVRTRACTLYKQWQIEIQRPL
jgi:hypothetical protein